MRHVQYKRGLTASEPNKCTSLQEQESGSFLRERIAPKLEEAGFAVETTLLGTPGDSR